MPKMEQILNVENELDPFIEDLGDYIISNIDREDITAEHLSSEFEISRRTLYRKLEETAEISVSEFVWNLRLHCAKQKIRTGDYDSADKIAREVGIKTTSYFIKKYEEEFGVHPKAELSNQNNNAT